MGDLDPVHVPHGHSRSVLLVDDDPRLTPLVRGLLAYLGFGSVEIAHDYATAQEILGRLPIALVICDLGLGAGPENGLTLLRWARSRTETRRVPFIVTEETFDFEEIITAVNVGANGILLKPYDAGLFRKKIQDAFRDVSRRDRDGDRNRSDYAAPQTFAQGLFAVQEAMGVKY